MMKMPVKLKVKVKDFSEMKYTVEKIEELRKTYPDIVFNVKVVKS